MPTRAFFRIVTLALVWACTLPALADAKVVVELKNPDGSAADGTVELKKGESRYACTTQAGRCDIPGVPGGMYTVEVKLPNRPSPKPKEVMIPPSGEAKLIVNAS